MAGQTSVRVSFICSGRRISLYLLVDRVLPPWHLHISIAFQRLSSFLYVLVQELQLTADEAGIGRISAPSGNINGIETAVN